MIELCRLRRSEGYGACLRSTGLGGKAADQTGAQRSGSGLERRSSGMIELSRLGRSEGYGACSDDEGAYRFRRGRGGRNSGRMRLTSLKWATL